MVTLYNNGARDVHQLILSQRTSLALGMGRLAWGRIATPRWAYHSLACLDRATHAWAHLRAKAAGCVD